MSALVSDYLRAARYEPHCMADGWAMVDAFKATPYDLILLDLMLPGRVEEAERLLGLDLGADDYISKTLFSPREIVARVRVVLRRSRKKVGSEPSKLEIDEDGHGARYNGVALDLTPIEFRLLKTLAGTPGRMFSRNALPDQLHADQRAFTDRAVDSQVNNLRRKLEQADAGQECLRSIYDVGYRFDA